jgi:hypothetical protein
MAVSGSGLQDSGLDRALQLALDAELDRQIESGELWPGEIRDFPDPTPRIEFVNRPWQRDIDEKREPPGTRASEFDLARCIVGIPAKPQQQYDYKLLLNFPDPSEPEKAEKRKYMRWRRKKVGIVVVHGIGPQLAGQTLLDWTRPIIQALKDAPRADPNLVLPSGVRDVKDPVSKSNIDFSGETFPVIQVRVPRRGDLPENDPRAQERTWVFTEAWWAQEVRPPSLSTMIGWLGEQGGVGRIVQGIQENMVGSSGPAAIVGRLSLQPIVSIVTSFVLLLFVLLLGIAKIIPFGPLRDAVVLRLAASFLTDWFGGARTLLRDGGQSANVRNRLAMTIKALRAYGCRDVVIIAHSGGTMASLMTLTDPAFPNLRVQKLITIGEALNLGWRLNAKDPDQEPPTPPRGDRMAADLLRLQPNLQWRDFWATHDPAPSGRPQLPENYEKETFPRVRLPRLTAERVYNRMSILDDHGGYWDNDEHFVIPLIREIDVPTGDRAASRFYGDLEESWIRARRKERVGLLALWRRARLSLPTVAILAAATISAPGFVLNAGDFAFKIFGLIPGNKIVADVADAIVKFFRDLSLENVPLIPAALQVPSLLGPLQTLGTWALEAVLIVLLLFALLPGQIDRLWVNGQRRRRWSFVLSVIDWTVGVGVFVVVAVMLIADPATRAQVMAGAALPALGLIAIGAVVAGMGWLGPKVRRRLRDPKRRAALLEKAPSQLRAVRLPKAPSSIARVTDRLRGPLASLARNAGIALSALVLGAVLITILVIILGVALVIIDGGEHNSTIQRFVIGAITTLFAFSLLGRLGNWRWNIWDVRERQTLRRKPMELPSRRWPWFIAIVLTAIVFAAASIVALGADGSSWLGVERDTWLVGVGMAIFLVVIFSLAKDVVDSDIDSESIDTVATEPATLSTDEPRPAPGT